jgi:hypothetical protein
MAKLVVEIPDAARDVLQIYADYEGVSIETLAVRLLLNYDDMADEPDSEGTLHDRLAPYIGLIPDEGYPPTAARDGSELFTDYLVQKKKEGHL